MTRKVLSLVVIALLALGATAVSAPAKHGDSGTKLEGRVLSVNRSAHTFRLKDAERGTATVTWTLLTKFEGIRSSQVRPGKRLQVRFEVVNGRKVATKIEHRSSNHS